MNFIGSQRGFRHRIMRSGHFTSESPLILSGQKIKQELEMDGLHVAGPRIVLYSPKLVVSGIFTRVLAVVERLGLLIKIVIKHRPNVVLSYSA